MKVINGHKWIDNESESSVTIGVKYDWLNFVYLRQERLGEKEEKRKKEKERE